MPKNRYYGGTNKSEKNKSEYQMAEDSTLKSHARTNQHHHEFTLFHFGDLKDGSRERQTHSGPGDTFQRLHEKKQDQEKRKWYTEIIHRKRATQQNSEMTLIRRQQNDNVTDIMIQIGTMIHIYQQQLGLSLVFFISTVSSQMTWFSRQFCGFQFGFLDLVRWAAQ